MLIRLISMAKPAIGVKLDCSKTRGGSQSYFAPSSAAGMVLPAVLMLLALLAALTLQTQMAARGRLAREQRAGAHTRLRALACDAAWQALQKLAEETAAAALIHTNAAWAALRREVLPDGTLLSVRVGDAARLFNVNNLGVPALTADVARLPEAIAAELLAGAQCPAPAAVAGHWRDWFAGHPAGLTGAVLQSTAELAALAPEAEPERLAELFSVLPDYGAGLAPVNVNTAPPEVLLGVLGQTRAFAAEALVKRRDAQPLQAVNNFAYYDSIRDCADYLDVRSLYFTVAAQAEQTGGLVRVWALAERDPLAQWRVRRWVCR